jgi:uncharacterized tellurite resistance protein B-like protein
MFDTLRRFVADLAGEERPAASSEEQEAHIAVAALLAFLVEADGEVTDTDRALLERVLASHFSLDRAEARSLAREGLTEEEEAVDFYAFTSRLNRALDEKGRREVVQMMWEVVLADGEIDELEDNIVWRVADLLGIRDRERIELKLAVQEKLKGAARN